MNQAVLGGAMLAVLLVASGTAGAFEKRAYEVVEEDRDFTLRDYGPAVVAETFVQGDFEDVGSTAFRILVAYISGENEASESIAMTAPVTQERPGEKIAMTAPVTQETAGEGYRFTFMMPSARSFETFPVPLDERVRLRREPGGRYAAVAYSGFWSRRNYDRHLEELRTWMNLRALEPTGDPVWARYDPPFMPWFWRRNEILIPVGEVGGAASS